MNYMKRTALFLLILPSIFGFGQSLEGDVISTENGDLIIQPIQHGSIALEWDGKIIFIDPYGGEDYYGDLPAPDIVLITDIHGDHMNKNTLSVLDLSKATLIVPGAVEKQLDDAFKNNLKVIGNDETLSIAGMEVLAIPMYNLPESEDSRHTKGRGNGYVLTIGGKKVYISGDTEDIPEMRSLKDIDVAFVCMNLPYTMNEEQAASAVLEFKPAIVYPFHYRGSGGLSDVEKFKSLVNDKNPDIEVRLRKWYK